MWVNDSVSNIVRFVRDVQKMARSNYPKFKYALAQSNLKKENKLSVKRIILEAGTRAIAKFNIKVDVDVARQTIHSCIKTDRLEVWHTGPTSPIILVKVTLNSFIINT